MSYKIPLNTEAEEVSYSEVGSEGVNYPEQCGGGNGDNADFSTKIIGTYHPNRIPNNIITKKEKKIYDKIKNQGYMTLNDVIMTSYLRMKRNNI